jgi:hypothetical protein
MLLEGTIRKDGRHWLIELAALDAMTQGSTRMQAREMMEDLVETMAASRDFRVTVTLLPDDRFELGSNDVRKLLALLLRRQREKSGLTLTETARRLGQTSPNAYARYEQGRAVPTIEKLEELLAAVAPGQSFVWRLAS